MVQPFNPDPRERDGTPNTTALGPNFPSSVQDLWRMVFRPSEDFLRYVKLAVSNDDGTPINKKAESLLAELDSRLAAIHDALISGDPLNIINNDLIVKGEIFTTDPIVPSGIVVAAAYANLDAMGTVATPVWIPRAGVIQSATFYDLSDQAQPVTLWLLKNRPTTTQTDNNAFALTDAELLSVLHTFYFVTFEDAANGQVAVKEAISKAYSMPGSEPLVEVWAFLQARGTPTVSAGALPTFTLDILVA